MIRVFSLGLIVTMVIMCGCAEKIPKQTSESAFSFEERDVLARREEERQLYTVEQKTIADFSREKKIEYAPYLAAYIFSVEVDISEHKLFIISELGDLRFNQRELEEVKRRVLFMDGFEEKMDRDYSSFSDPLKAFNPRRFGWPEYKDVLYSPFSSVNRTDTHLYGFLNKPKRVSLIAGTNFIEEGGLFGKQTNPQAIFIDYDYGPTEGSLEERQKKRFKLLDEEFKKTKAQLDSSRLVDRLRYIEKACQITGKTKEEIAILDVGCGFGAMVNMLRAEGYKKIYGIDMDSSKISVLQKVCQENGISQVTSALINLNAKDVLDEVQARLGQKTFDIILLHNTIEHIPDPCRTLHILRFLLAKGGVIFLTGIPDEDCFAAWFGGSTYGDYDKFTHLNFFTKESISAFAGKEGFDVIFLHDSNVTSNLNWSFVYEECLPYVLNEKWFVLGKELPEGITIRDIFPDNALHYNIYSCRPQDGKRLIANFERYRLYEKHKDYVNLLFKKFFVEVTDKIISLHLLKDKLEALKEDLFNTLVLNRPTGISEEERGHLESISEEKAILIKEKFQEEYHLSLRTRWCFFLANSTVF